MAAVRPQQVVEQIVTTLTDNITDLNTKRKNEGRNWIFWDFPQGAAEMPRIGVVKLSGIGTPQAVNSSARRETALFQVSVFLAKGNRFDYDSDGSAEKAEDVLDYLSTEVINSIQENQADFQALGVLHLNYVSEDNTSPGDTLQNNIIFEAQYQRG